MTTRPPVPGPVRAPRHGPAWLPPVPVMVAAALLLLTCLSWAALTPDLRPPDETAHVNSVVRVAEGGGWPAPGHAHVRSEVRHAQALSGATRDGAQTYLPRTPVGPTAPRFTDVPPTGAAQRLSLAQLRDGTPDRTLDQMTQHPPGYYAVTALVFRALGADHWRYDRAIFLLRALTGLTVAASVPVCCWLTVRDLGGREPWAQAAAFLPLLVPQLGFVGGAVTNDGLTVAAASVLFAALVRLARRGPDPRRLVVVAVVTGLLCWTKGTALTLLPAVPCAVALAHARHRSGPGRAQALRALRDATAVLTGAFVIGGWWWALNLLRYGRIQPAAYRTPVEDGPVLPLLQFAQVFAKRISASFIGNIGLLEAPMPVVVTAGLTAVLLLAALAGLPARRWGERAVFLLVAGLTLGVLFSTTYRAHQQTHALPGLQGRYLFVVLVPLLALVATGLGRGWTALRLPDRALVPTACAAGLLVSAYGLVFGLLRYYRAPGDTVRAAVDRFNAWSAWPTGVLALLPLAVLAGLVPLVLAWQRAAPAEDASPVTSGQRRRSPVG